MRRGTGKSPLASAIDFEQEIGEVYQLIWDLASDIQALSHGLHPPKLELIGLNAAVAGLCEELSNRGERFAHPRVLSTAFLFGIVTQGSVIA